MHTKNLENSSEIESFMGQNAQAHKSNLMSVYSCFLDILNIFIGILKFLFEPKDRFLSLVWLDL